MTGFRRMVPRDTWLLMASEPTNGRSRESPSPSADSNGREINARDRRGACGTTTLLAMSAYYSEQVSGPQSRTEADFNQQSWGGIVAIIERGIERGVFADEFPEQCPD